jgi:hypothetical protein
MGQVTVPASDAGAGVVIAVLFVGVLLMFAVQRLGRTRAGFRIGQAIAVAFVIRLLAIAAINATGLGASLRGGDENLFLYYAQLLAAQPINSHYLPHSPDQLHVVLFALQIKLGFINATALRVTQTGIALLGFILMLAATYDLAGPKAATLAAWVLAFEPSSIFFNTEIHKEPLMELGAGLAVFGGVWLWKRLDIRGIFICALGCAICILTRSYAGWFLACGCVLMVLHASLRNLTHRRGSALILVYAVVIAAAIAAPTLLSATGGKNLRQLQLSSAQNSSGVGQQGHSNLALEKVNLSSRGAVLTSLPTKIRELLLQPYPWQVSNSSQMFGSVGTLVAYLVLLLLIRYAWLSRGHIFERAGPLIYPLLFEMLAYAVTVGNAGTGFRYRSHLVTLGICAVAVLRARVREQRVAATADAGLTGKQDLIHAEMQPLTA